MKEIILKTKKIPTLVSTDKELLWYDIKTKKMIKGRGTKIKHIYNPKTKENKVEFITEKNTISHKNNFQDIIAWINKNKNKFNFDVSDVSKNYYVVITTNKDNTDEIIEDLYRNKIEYDYS